MTTATSTRKRPRRNPNARYEVYSGYRNERGTVSETETRKFDWLTDAWEYAQTLPDDTAHAIVHIDKFSAAWDWNGLEIRSRYDGAWCGVYPGSVFPYRRPLTPEEIENMSDWKNQK